MLNCTSENEPAAAATTTTISRRPTEEDQRQRSTGPSQSESGSSLAPQLSGTERRLSCEHPSTSSRQQVGEQTQASQTGTGVLTTEREEDCTWLTGEQARCNCSGRRRSTLAGLIELFEQKVTLEQPDHVDIGKLNLARRQKNTHASCKREGQFGDQEANKQASDQMRNIITPVVYDDSNQSAEDEADSAARTARKSSEVRPFCEEQLSNKTRKRAINRVATKGVPVLPTPEANTSRANKGGQLSGRCSQQLFNSRDSCKQASSSYSTQRRLAPSRAAPSIVRHRASSSRRLLSQLARLRRLSEPNYRVKRPEKVAQVEELIDQLERATIDWEDDEHLLDRAERRDWPAEYQRRYCSGSNGRLGDDFKSPLKAENRDTNLGLRLDVNPLEEAAIERSHNNLFGEQMETKLPLGDSWSAQSTLNRAPRRPRQRAYADRYLDDLAVRRLGGSPVSTASECSTSRHQMSYLLCSNAYTPSIETPSPDWPLEDLERARSDDLHYRSLSARTRLVPHEPPFGIPRQISSAGAHSSASHYLRRLDNRDSAYVASTGSPSTRQTEKLTCSNLHHVNLDYGAANNSEGRVNSRVSFKVDQSRASVDSGRPLSTACSRLTPYSDGSASPLNRKPTDSCKLPNDQDFFYEDDAAQEVLLENGLLSDEQLELERIFAESATETPTLERHRASIGMAPHRRRPKIKIENPRSKSPLLRRPEVGQHKPNEKMTGEPGVYQAVKIRCYEEAHSLDRPVSELECHYDFDAELDDEVAELSQAEQDEPRAMGQGEAMTSVNGTQVAPGFSSSDANESSLERLNYRGASPWVEQSEHVAVMEPKDKSVAFSIGQYKPLNKPNLKIL